MYSLTAMGKLEKNIMKFFVLKQAFFWKKYRLVKYTTTGNALTQCWTQGKSSAAVGEDLRPTAMALAAKV